MKMTVVWTDCCKVLPKHKVVCPACNQQESTLQSWKERTGGRGQGSSKQCAAGSGLDASRGPEGLAEAAEGMGLPREVRRRGEPCLQRGQPGDSLSAIL